MGDNFQSTPFPPKDFSTRDKQARSDEGEPKVALVET